MEFTDDEWELALSSSPSSLARAATPLTAREFLDAASDGNVDAVDAWLAGDPCGDVNVVQGEGWTALLYAVSRSHLRVAQRLVVHPDIDLNATTVMVAAGDRIGTSALAMALKRRNNTMTRLLLTHGASRYTIPYMHMKEALASTWMWVEVKRMLSPQWSVRWSPELHARFPFDQREKCRLVVFANTLVLREVKRKRPTHPQVLHSQSQPKPQSQNRVVAPSALCGLSESAKLFVWDFLDSLGITERSEEEEETGLLASRTNGDEDGGERTMLHQTESSITTIATHRPPRAIHWIYLPQPIIHHILEFAIYLW